MTVRKTCPCGRSLNGTDSWASHTRSCRDYQLAARNRLALAVVSYEAVDEDEHSRQAFLGAARRRLARIEQLLAAWPEGERAPWTEQSG